MKVKFLKEVDKYKVGDTENVTAENAKELIAQGYAAPLISPEQKAEAGSHTEDEDIQGRIKEAVAEAIKAQTPTPAPKPQPATPEPAYKTLWQFASDVSKIGSPGGRPSKAWGEYVKTVGSDELAEALGDTGGALVPTEFRAQLMEKAMESAIVRPRAMVIPMASNRIQFPYVNETNRSSTLYGGINPAKVAEKGQRTGTKPAFGLCELKLNTHYAMSFVTNELVQDSPISLGPIIQRLYTNAVGFEADELYITTGTGAGEPLGILNADCTVSVAKETNQTATTIVAENVIKMYSRMWPQSLGTAVWLVAPNTIPQLMTMSIAVGTGGVPVYLPGNNIAGAPFGTLLGRPVIVTEKAITLGTVGDIIFADFSQYALGIKAGGDIQVSESGHLRFDYNEMAYRFELRHDGQPIWNAAMTPRNGGDTLSPFITLATRS